MPFFNVFSFGYILVGLGSFFLVFLVESQEAEGSSQCHWHTDEGRVVVAQSPGNRDAAEEGAHGISQVECRLDAATAQHLASLAMLYDEELLWRSDAEEAGAADKHHGCGNPPVVGEEEGCQQGCSRQELEIAGESAWLHLVCEIGTHLVAHHHAQSCENHQDGDTGSTKSTIQLQERGYVTEPAEDSAVAQEGGGDDEPRGEVSQESELRLHALVGQCLHIGNPSIYHIQGNDAQDDRHQERCSPRDVVA